MTMDTKATRVVLNNIFAERERQHEKWGVQDHPNEAWGAVGFADNRTDEQNDSMRTLMVGVSSANEARSRCQRRAAEGRCSYPDILVEEVCEAIEVGNDPVALRAELVQVAAVCVQWIEAIDRAGGA